MTGTPNPIVATARILRCWWRYPEDYDENRPRLYVLWRAVHSFWTVDADDAFARLQFWLQGFPAHRRPRAMVIAGNLISKARYYTYLIRKED